MKASGSCDAPSAPGAHGEDAGGEPPSHGRVARRPAPSRLLLSAGGGHGWSLALLPPDLPDVFINMSLAVAA